MGAMKSIRQNGSLDFDVVDRDLINLTIPL
jgi:hypothetical protein